MLIPPPKKTMYMSFTQSLSHAPSYLFYFDLNIFYNFTLNADFMFLRIAIVNIEDVLFLILSVCLSVVLSDLCICSSLVFLTTCGKCYAPVCNFILELNKRIRVKNIF